MVLNEIVYRIVVILLLFAFFFFFNDTATTEIYTLSLHDALPISRIIRLMALSQSSFRSLRMKNRKDRSEEHTSELQSRPHLVCRLLLEKKKTKNLFRYQIYSQTFPCWL